MSNYTLLPVAPCPEGTNPEDWNPAREIEVLTARGLRRVGVSQKAQGLRQIGVNPDTKEPIFETYDLTWEETNERVAAEIISNHGAPA
jgi:hypothetical protein